MKFTITEQSRFTVKHTTYEETKGMQKGYSITRSLIKVYDNKKLIGEFTNEDFELIVAIFVSGDVTIKICKNENSVKRAWFWKFRKNDDLIVINTKI